MVKMVVLYKQPENSELFDEKYFGEHLELNAMTPGIVRSEISRFFDLRGGQTEYYVMAEVYFADRDALLFALKSPESKAAGAQLQSFASGLATFHFAEVIEA
ncbi:MAG: EthD family reductase [Acidibacillus sp.]|uniref:Ethyl tert-butyl ether degradation protein EthD n=1 Tax=Sulfoacidibacillus ferrooxidans TaxID=2005001 RepID=A0A9X1V875_9BACL|nr:EthD family reductase [Sulfoacidibacillus ferrooxidans]MCI0182570.1 hypothetical protein [Sulfoacidibacillus ferrooxidans]MCY0894157.1 EthD family reductase [Acidibacillus sp.]